jgi:hypothetical protein
VARAPPNSSTFKVAAASVSTRPASASAGTVTVGVLRSDVVMVTLIGSFTAVAGEAAGVVMPCPVLLRA